MKMYGMLGHDQETYDTFTTSAASRLKWLCDKCDKALAVKKDDDNETEDILKVLEQLVGGTKAVEQKLDSIDHVLDGKADKEYVHSLEDQDQRTTPLQLVCTKQLYYRRYRER